MCLLRSVDLIITYIFPDINDLVNRRSKERVIQINGDQRLENQHNLSIFECSKLCLCNRSHEMALTTSGGRTLTTQ